MSAASVCIREAHMGKAHIRKRQKKMGENPEKLRVKEEIIKGHAKAVI